MSENGGKEEVELEEENDEKKKKKYEVLMWGYLPGVLSHKSPLTSPVEVQLPENGIDVQSWKDVCGGGCGFAMAISGPKGFTAQPPIPPGKENSYLLLMLPVYQ